MPPDVPRFGRFQCTNFSLGCTFKISPYSADYQYLIAYEIIAQGWKKRLGLEGVGGEGVHFKNCYCQVGGGGKIQFSYVIIFGGGGG